MKSSFYNLLIGLSSFIVLIMPFIGTVYDRGFKWYSRIRPKGWIVILSFIFGVVISYVKDYQQEIEEARKEKSTEKDKIEASKASRKLSDESNAKTIETFTKSLALYGLKYDSSEKVIQKLVADSSKKEVKNFYGADPELYIYNILNTKRTPDSLTFRIEMSTNHQSSLHVKINIITLIEPANGLFFGTIPIFIMDDTTIPLTKISGQNMSIALNKEAKYIYVIFFGSYKDKKNKEYPFKEIQIFFPSEGKYGNIQSDKRTQITDFLHKHKINY